MVKKAEVNLLNALITVSPDKNKYKNEMKQVVELFKDRKILTVQTARKVIDKLSSKNKKANVKGLELLEQYQTKETATGRLTRSNKPTKYYVRGHANLTTKYYSKRKGVLTDYGKTYHDTITRTTEVMAKSKEEAKQIYIQNLNDEIAPNPQKTKYAGKFTEVDDVFIDDVVQASNGNSEMDSFMRSVLPFQYEFIPMDNSLLEKDGECVIDQISKLYGEKIKGLQRDKLIQKVKEIEKSYCSLDSGVVGYDNWKLADGVRARTINSILKSYDISYYSYDINTNCFDKYITKNKNYPALIYYSVNNHMYIVRDKFKAKSLVEKAKDIEIQIRTDMLDEMDDTNIFADRVIFENVDIKDLMDEKYKNALIIYNEKVAVNHNEKTVDYHNKTNISDKLQDIIKIHHYIPEASNLKHSDSTAITQIKFNKNDQNIILSIDPNYSTHGRINFKDINAIIDIHNNSVGDKHDKIEFKNQTIGAISKQLRNNHYNSTTKRIKFTKEKRMDFFY